MTNDEANKVLKELHEVRTKKLNGEAKRLFEAIMIIADCRDKAEADLYEANNRIVDLMNIIEERDKAIIEIKSICINNKPHTAQQKIIKYIEERCHNG